MSKFTEGVRRELRELVPAMLFFLVAFHMLSLTMGLALGAHDITVATSTLATVSAIIVAKTILLMEHTAVARWFSSRLIFNLLWKTVLFGTVALLLRQLEELVPVLVHHGDLGAALRRQADNFSTQRFLVIHMWLYTMLLIYSLASEAVVRVGRDGLQAIMLGPVQARHDGRAAPPAQ